MELPGAKQVSEMIGVPVGTLRYWRHSDIGPASFTLGRRCGCPGRPTARASRKSPATQAHRSGRLGHRPRSLSRARLDDSASSSRLACTHWASAVLDAKPLAALCA